MSNIQRKNQEQKELVNTSLFDGMSTGFEETSQETFKTPFLKILQDLSPECKKKSSDFIDEAEPGLFCNSATKQLYGSIDVIVLKVTHNLVVWKPKRGGFVGVFDKAKENEIVVKRDGLLKLDAEGNEVVDTISFYCVNANDPSDIFIFPLSKSGFKHASKFATKLRMLKINGKNAGVSFAGVWKIESIEETNDKGSWFTLAKQTFERFITEEEFNHVIKPTLELLKKADTDFSQMDTKSDDDDETVEY